MDGDRRFSDYRVHVRLSDLYAAPKTHRSGANGLYDLGRRSFVVALTMSDIVTLDFEASCLPQHGRSFPIEVGVALPDGRSRAWLIRPHAGWRGWTWTEEAERLHGLSLDELDRDGLPATVVLDELRAALGDRPAYVDSYFDARWMRTLETAAGAPPLIKVLHIDALMSQWNVKEATVARAVAEANRLRLRRHTARGDAIWLQVFVQALTLKEAASPYPVA